MFLFGCFCVSVFLCVCACERSSTVCGATLARRAEWKHATQSHVNCPGQWSYHGAAKHNCAPRYRYSGVQSNIFRRWTPRFLTKNQICVPFLFWVIDTTFLMKGCATTNQICVSPQSWEIDTMFAIKGLSDGKYPICVSLQSWAINTTFAMKVLSNGKK